MAPWLFAATRIFFSDWGFQHRALMNRELLRDAASERLGWGEKRVRVMGRDIAR